MRPVAGRRGPDAGEGRSVATWLAVSLVLHFLVIGTWEGARRLALSRPDLLPEWVRRLVMPELPLKSDPMLALTPEQRKAAEEQVEIPLSFIEVDPAEAVAEPPKQAQFESTDNTLAGNPNPPVAEATLPRVEGKQEQINRIMDITRVSPPQPASVPEPQVPIQQPEESSPPLKSVKKAAEVEQPASTPKPADPVAEKPASPVRVEEVKEGGLRAGETQLAKVTPKPVVPRPQTPVPPQPKVERSTPSPEEEAAPPRRAIKRLSEAREQKGIIVGEKMKQEGGVRRFSMEASLDVKASPFANYDRQFIYAVQQRWYALLDEHHYALDRVGKVVLRFKLRSDGTVSDMTQVESSVGDVWALLCESAVVSQSPFARWPDWMRRMVGSDAREITFTFYYNVN